MNEEIIVRFGADSRPLAQGLRGLRGMVADVGSSIKNSMVGVGASIAGALSAGAVMNQLSKLSDFVEQIKRTSEGTGVSVGLTQDFLNLAKAAGVSGDAVESALGKFVSRLGAGEDPEGALFALADKMASIPDPAERARLAVENFGQAGIKMIPILSQGSDELKKMADEFGRLSDEQIALVDSANEVLDRFAVKTLVVLAKALEGISLVFETLKRQWDTAFTDNSKSFSDDFKDIVYERLEASMKREDQKSALSEAAKQQRLIQDGLKARDSYEKKLRDVAIDRASTEEKILMLTEDVMKARRELDEMSDKPEAERYKQMEKILDLEQRIANLRQNRPSSSRLKNHSTPNSGHERTPQQQALDEAHQKVLAAASHVNRVGINSTTAGNWNKAVAERNAIFQQIQAQRQQTEAPMNLTDQLLGGVQEAPPFGAALRSGMRSAGTASLPQSTSEQGTQIKLQEIITLLNQNGIVIRETE